MGRALQITDDKTKPYKLVRNAKGRYRGKQADANDDGSTKFVEATAGIPSEEQHSDEYTQDIDKAGAAPPNITKPNFIVRPKIV